MWYTDQEKEKILIKHIVWYKGLLLTCCSQQTDCLSRCHICLITCKFLLRCLFSIICFQTMSYFIGVKDAWHQLRQLISYYHFTQVLFVYLMFLSWLEIIWSVYTVTMAFIQGIQRLFWFVICQVTAFIASTASFFFAFACFVLFACFSVIFYFGYCPVSATPDASSGEAVKVPPPRPPPPRVPPRTSG